MQMNMTVQMNMTGKANSNGVTSQLPSIIMADCIR